MDKIYFIIQSMLNLYNELISEITQESWSKSSRCNHGLARPAHVSSRQLWVHGCFGELSALLWRGRVLTGTGTKTVHYNSHRSLHLAAKHHLLQNRPPSGRCCRSYNTGFAHGLSQSYKRGAKHKLTTKINEIPNKSMS